MSNLDPTTRFSKNAKFYAKYRPTYPASVIDVLKQECHITANSKIADMGAGTGIFSQLLLERGFSVMAVEPNDAMRAANANLLNKFKGYQAIAATAEDTTLPDHSVDLITAAQAFHWFDLKKIKTEFKRILKPQGWIALLWNLRLNEQSLFMQAYEDLLQKFGTDYHQVCCENAVDDEGLINYFAPAPVKIFKIPNTQIFNWESLRGRLLSVSYLPTLEDPRCKELLVAAKEVFDLYQENEQVKFYYETKLYLMQISSPR